MSWFSRLGLPLDADERHAVASYLAALGLPADMPVRVASSWAEAAALCSRRADEWWRAEAAERERLGRTVALEAIIAESTAAMAAAKAGCEDPATAYAAGGAATLATHEARLARAAGAPETHMFLRKIALYEAGRWPLGVYAGEFAIF